ncbi:MAG TPA: histone deacetylase [Candidatus Melainabacteria bacterium]|nr:histone deacetylase [Candidatus Melainabacteria bacterium]
MKLRLVYDPRYNSDLSVLKTTVHFALDRGQRVLDELAERNGITIGYCHPKPLSKRDLLLVHEEKYLQSLQHPKTWQQIFGLPKAPENNETTRKAIRKLLAEIRLKAGGTLHAAKHALQSGLAANLGAGYHHAFADHGDGYCSINDVAIAIRKLRAEGLCQKVMIVDVDLHQGNGNAAIFRDDPDVFTFDIHSQEAYPQTKEKSSLDIAISDDERHLYQEKLEAGLNQALASFSPDLVFFVQGSDPYVKDIGSGFRYLRLTLEQLKKRDKFVIDTCVSRGIPLALVFAGGYGPDVWRVHYNAVQHMMDKEKA